MQADPALDQEQDEEAATDLPYDRDDTFSAIEDGVFLSPAPSDSGAFASTSRKGSIAEALVIADVIRRGYRVSIPYCADSPYDLLVDRDGRIERVQVKFAKQINDGVSFLCKSRHRTYTSSNIDWIAACEPVSGQVFYVPAGELGSGRSSMTLRFTGTTTRRRLANNYMTF